MAEQTFRSPGFFEREIDLSGRETEPTGTPAGVIGVAERGPAFIPVTIGSMADFNVRFGDLDPKMAGPYAVNEYLKHKDAVTYMRVLGAGSNDTTAEIEATRTYGIVAKAGFKVAGTTTTVGDSSRKIGIGQPTFLVAKHHVSASVEGFSMPQFSDNNSFKFASTNIANVLRGVIFPTTGSRVVITAASGSLTAAVIDKNTNSCELDLSPGSKTFKKFRIIVSSSAGTGFSNDDSLPGCRILPRR